MCSAGRGPEDAGSVLRCHSHADGTGNHHTLHTSIGPALGEGTTPWHTLEEHRSLRLSVTHTHTHTHAYTHAYAHTHAHMLTHMHTHTHTHMHTHTYTVLE